jgi:hypothetical protein
MRRAIYKISLSLTLMATLIGCGTQHQALEHPATVTDRDVVVPQRDANGTPIGTAKVPSPEVSVPQGWTPKNVDLQCAVSGGCPSGVGLLLFVYPGTNSSGDTALLRCTGFMVSADKVVSNGHCDASEKGTGYFVVHGASGTMFRKITGLVKDSKSFTHGEVMANGEELASGRPDAAVFKLESSFPNDIVALTLDLVGPMTYGMLTAYSVNAVPPVKPDPKKPDLEDGHYKIEAQSCLLHRHEQIFPYNPEDSADVLDYFDCHLRGGNSGSPMINKDGLVVAIHQASSDTPPTADQVRKSEGREQLAFEQHLFGVGTNVRCLSYLGGTDTCVAATKKERSARFSKAQKDVLESVVSYPLENPDSYSTRFMTLAYPLVFSANDFLRSWDVVYYPNCRRDPKAPSHLMIPEQLVKLNFDEWAMPKLVSTALRPSPMTVLKPHPNDVFDVKVDWTPAPGELTDANKTKDLRVIRATRFPIALHVCGG